jgi:hypothetical protein
MFLTADELARLTGYRRPSAQIRWLKARRVRHFVNAAGLPVVARAWLGVGGEIVTMPPRVNLAALPGA